MLWVRMIDAKQLKILLLGKSFSKHIIFRGNFETVALIALLSICDSHDFSNYTRINIIIAKNKAATLVC